MAMAADIRNTATRRWGILVLLTLLGAAVGLAYALIRPPEYTAKAYVAVVAENAGDSSAVSYAQAYSRIASQGDALQTAADASGGSTSVQDLRRSVLASASPDAPVIELTGTAGSPERAADLVNLVANGLTKTANTHTGDTRMRLAPLSAAAPPADPTSPQLPLALVWARRLVSSSVDSRSSAPLSGSNHKPRLIPNRQRRYGSTPPQRLNHRMEIPSSG
jgi:capsular polysaccharide biosynthesis protein